MPIMPIFDAALAFALTMLLVATVVTQIVNVLRNTAALRSRELRRMLERCFDEELKPVIDRETRRIKGNVDSTLAARLAEAADAFDRGGLIRKAESEHLVSLSTEEYLEYVKRSTLARKLYEELGGETEAVFLELGKRYEAVGRRFSESFQMHSRRWATGVALTLAVVLNIDSIHIANAYMRDTSLSADIAAQLDTHMAEYRARLDASGQDDSGSADALRNAVAASRTDIQTLRTLGLPIGWSVFPHALALDGDGAERVGEHTLWAWVSWVLGVVLTAALAGLGAPFWYDALRSVSQAAQRRRLPRETTK